MKFAALILIATALGSSFGARAQTVDTMAECKRDTTAYLETYNKGDLAGLIAMYDANAIFSSPFWTGQGQDAIAGGFKAELAGGVKFTQIGCTRSSRAGLIGYAEGPWSATTKGPDGKEMAISGHFVAVVKTEDGKDKFLFHLNNFQLPPPGAPTTH